MPVANNIATPRNTARAALLADTVWAPLVVLDADPEPVELASVD